MSDMEKRLLRIAAEWRRRATLARWRANDDAQFHIAARNYAKIARAFEIQAIKEHTK